MKTTIIPFIVLVFLVSCGRELEKKISRRQPFNLRQNQDALSVSTKDFYSNATSFTMFFLPAEEDLNFASDLYRPEDTYQDKLAAIFSHILKKSDEYDHSDLKIIEVRKVKAPLTAKYEELGCDLEFKPECDEVDAQIKEIDKQLLVNVKKLNGTEAVMDMEGYKSFILEEIQASLDVYDRVNPDNNKPKNWMLYGDAPEYVFEELENGSMKIVLAKVGPFGSQNRYSTETGEIHHVRFRPSEFDHSLQLLEFIVDEKDAEGKFNGNTWDVTLERGYVAQKLRYKGDVLKKDPAGKVLRRGNMKVDFARR